MAHHCTPDRSSRTPPRDAKSGLAQLEEGVGYYVDHIETGSALSLSREEFAQVAAEYRTEGDEGQIWCVYDVGDGHGHIAIVNPRTGQALRLHGHRMGTRVVPAIYDRYDKSQYWHVVTSDLADPDAGFYIRHGDSGLYLGLGGAAPGGHLAGWPLGHGAPSLRWLFGIVPARDAPALDLDA